MVMSESSSSLSLFKMVSRLLVLLSLLRLCREGVCQVTTEPLTAAFGRLDLTELQQRLFDVKISNQPVTHESPATVDSSESTVTVWSKHGQQYRCVLPAAAARVNSDSGDTPVDLDDNMVNITKLLLPMRGKCYYKNEGWWTYQYCHGDEVTQFHIEAGKTVGATIVLGKYASEKQWEKDELLTVMKRQSVQSLHAKSVDFTAMTVSSHEAEYVNGTLCNLNGRSRQANVKIICNLNPSSKTAILNVVEETTCNYTLIVHSPLLCDHPAFKPPLHNKLVSITCSPVVSIGRYQEYLKQAEEQSHKKLVKQEDSDEESNDKNRPNKLPLNVVLNSLASSVVEKLNQRKAAKKRNKEEGSDDEEEEDVFKSEEVDAMIDEMVAETLENVMGMKMPQPHDNGDTATTDQQQSDQQVTAGQQHTEPERQQHLAPSRESQKLTMAAEKNGKKNLGEAAVKETSKDDSSEAIQVKVYVGDQESNGGGTKVIELEADSSKTDDMVSMLSGIIGELMEVENEEKLKRRKKQESLELSYARSWEKRKKEK